MGKPTLEADEKSGGGAVQAGLGKSGASVTVKISKRSSIVVVFAIAAVLVLVASASAQDGSIPWGGTTVLPDYVGAPAKAHPTANNGVPQNPLLAPNGFNLGHLDPWMSDTANFAGPLGLNPAVFSSTFADVRNHDREDEVPWIFLCIAQLIDSHGRVIALCFAPYEATVVLADPDTLQVLSHYHLELPSGDPFLKTGRQELLRSVGGCYSFLDGKDQLTIVSGGKKIVTLVEAGTADSPVLELAKTYDLTPMISAPGDDIVGTMLDWQGRLWLTTAGTGRPATVGVLNPATYTNEEPNVHWLELPGELIRNTFPVTKVGVDRTAAYVDTSLHMYRIEAGPNDIPEVVWSEPYDTSGELKPGQYELGSGTSPTILGEGKYVAITDNASPMKVVVFRTDAQLDPGEERIVCEVPVFENTPGALSNSLVGSRLSLIATNNYNYLWNWHTGQTEVPSEPGAERIDIDPNGRGCMKVWTNTEMATTTSPRLSTKTGLIYTVAREYDDQNDLYVYYWVALDFRTGKTVWKKMAGTGEQFDSFYPGIVIGRNGALYGGVYGGLITIRDTP